MTEDEFINLATEKGPDKRNIRTSLAGYFHTVQKNLPCSHYVYDALYISHHILKTHHIPGDIAEFGCFEGGMSAKLAKVAQLTGKKYYIFDSFTGLPHEASYEVYEPEIKSLGEFTKNQYSCSRKKVQENLKWFKVEKQCILIEGLIENTLPNNIKPFHTIFIDVDLHDTAQFIIKNLWNHIQSPGIFTHEACLKGYMEHILNPEWWHENLKRKPPKFQGKPGLQLAGCLDFLYKDENYNP